MNILKKLTANYLKLNKKRTLVTIIGIILSGAMISAVTTLAVSFQAFMIDYEIETGGSWEARFEDIPYSELKYFENNNQIEDSFIESNLYMAENEYSTENYLRIDQYEEDAIEKLGEKLLRGELPKNSDEIALSNTFFDGKENEPQIGDTVTFNVGYVEDVEGTDDNPYGVKFVQTGTKTYKITGIIQRPTFESSTDYYTAGITIMDRNTLKENTPVNVGIIMKDKKEIYKNQYIKYGFTISSTVLLTSNINTSNYTVVPQKFESEYLYTYIFTLYKKMFLSKLNYEFENKFEAAEKEFLNFTTKVWIQDVTNEEFGRRMEQNWAENLELEKTFNKLKNEYDVTYKKYNVEELSKNNKVTFAVVITILVINILTIIFTSLANGG